MLSIEHIQAKLSRHKPIKHSQRQILKRSAVAICLRDNKGITELLMIKRAERLGDTWSGQMAFPGGRMDPEDSTILGTAMRECHEELGVDVTPHTHYLHRLDDMQATGGGGILPLVVTPFVLHMHSTPEFNPNHEVAATVWIPLELFRQPGKREFFEISHQQIDHALPCYMFKGYRVWGMSLRMIEGMLEQLAS